MVSFASRGCRYFQDKKGSYYRDRDGNYVRASQFDEKLIRQAPGLDEGKMLESAEPARLLTSHARLYTRPTVRVVWVMAS